MAQYKWDRDKIFRASGSYWQSSVLHAAVALDIFSVLADRKQDSKIIARKIKADERALTMLLNALASMRLISKTASKYSNTSESRLFLSQDSPQYIGHMIIHHHHTVDSWTQLDKAVKSGRPVRTKPSFSDKNLRESFLMGMFNIAMGIAPKLAAKIDIGGRRCLLDLGGGPGTYAIHFCLYNPALKATVFDLPTTRPFAEKIIKKFNLSQRIKFVSGDYLKDPIPSGFDIAWLSHILHAEGPKHCRRIIKKTVSALEAGGMIVIHDFILNNKMDGPLFPALFSLNMLLGTEQGQTYSERQLRDMLADEGVKRIRRIPFKSANDSGIIEGII